MRVIKDHDIHNVTDKYLEASSMIFIMFGSPGLYQYPKRLVVLLFLVAAAILFERMLKRTVKDQKEKFFKKWKYVRKRLILHTRILSVILGAVLFVCFLSIVSDYKVAPLALLSTNLPIRAMIQLQKVKKDLIAMKDE